MQKAFTQHSLFTVGKHWRHNMTHNAEALYTVWVFEKLLLNLCFVAD
jgi:hypothetical protein